MGKLAKDLTCHITNDKYRYQKDNENLKNKMPIHISQNGYSK